MMTRPGAIRILGIASTSRGFSFAVVENAERLVYWGSRRPQSSAALSKALDSVQARTRPAFAACETARRAWRGDRGQRVFSVLKTLCERNEIFLVSIDRDSLLGDTGTTRQATNRLVAEVMSRRFPALARRLPKPRRIWDGNGDSLGIFLAAFAAVAAIDGMRSHERMER